MFVEKSQMVKMRVFVLKMLGYGTVTSRVPEVFCGGTVGCRQGS